MKPITFFLLILFVFSISACTNERLAIPRQNPNQLDKNKDILPPPNLEVHRLRRRSPIPLAKSQYEGSLWKDESSWGNLMRDHRARFKNDVVTITNLASIIIIEEDEPAPAVPVAAAAAADGTEAQPVVKKTPKKSIRDQETKQVLQSLKNITARVVKVLPNGHLVVRGEKVDYRRQNAIRYVTIVKGIIRPEDISETNEIIATKMDRPEVKVTPQISIRRVQARTPRKRSTSASVVNRLGKLASSVAAGGADGADQANQGN